jgi:DNA adenine methylase
LDSIGRQKPYYFHFLLPAIRKIKYPRAEFTVMARPFLKWAGGKRQLISEIEARLPEDIDDCTTYVEPFIGGGAVLFHLLKTRSFEAVHISDLNPELILCYRTLQEDAPKVIKYLSKLVDSYPSEQDQRKDSFYGMRKEWNSTVGRIEALSKAQKAKRAAQTLFLNKTCFNGLFRVNRKGEFNVPIGSYVNPSFSTPEDLLEVQSALQGVTIHEAPFEECEKWVNDRTFVYFDPPYRPLSKTSHFVSYSKGDFNDKDQERLAALFHTLDGMGAQLLLSNSDPKNTVPDDDFFDDLYSKFMIDRVLANRAINSNPDRRGAITELLVRNYD